jgi:hypothetical protein
MYFYSIALQIFSIWLYSNKLPFVIRRLENESKLEMNLHASSRPFEVKLLAMTLYCLKTIIFSLALLQHHRSVIVSFYTEELNRDGKNAVVFASELLRKI